ncbi:hypothetical protein G7Y89_g11676 [Cudoniella acicularis]|uniref:Flavin-containing monooxygenase n=1 Tax=Cudoniella acicularis TaxID=354080 RepID=A0A8H4RE33_9HELO|nr:hypothetical protein G7Y89_g11676 [Cudoniella acicularis]
MSNPNSIPGVDYGRNTNRADVLIIGAGISGLTTAIEMIRKGNGRNFIIVERGNQVGGTWNDQRYPGCCCDVWSHLYSFSFEPNPNWTREYPGQEEILDYLIGVAHKYQLYRHIRFNTSVEEARWDDSSNTWHTKLMRLGSKDAEFGEEYTITSNFLVSAVGQLNVPKFPDIKGLDSFQGKPMHSARWDWDYDIRDKKVGIIGNGATAAQIIPEVAKRAYERPTFARENVLLETAAIQKITPNGVIVDGEKEHEFDVLILATGFKTTQFMYPIKIYGADGKSIEDRWSSGASAYLGMTIPSMPNFSMLYGPNTNLGHNSIILMIEAQAMYINALIKKVIGARDIGGSLRIEPKLHVMEQYNKEIQARLSKSAFADPNCNSWYKNEEGLITNNWSDAVIPYQIKTSSIHWDEFDISGKGADDVKQEGMTSWPRVVEETQVSNKMILAGLIATAGVATVGILFRGSLKSALRH